MPLTVTIPATTLQPGVRDFGPANLPNPDTAVELRIDRTVPGGFDATPGAVVEIEAMVSLDGGATWRLAVGGTMLGGQLFHPGPPRGDGSPVTFSAVGTGLLPGTGRRIKATITVTGPTVAVAGTLTTS